MGKMNLVGRTLSMLTAALALTVAPAFAGTAAAARAQETSAEKPKVALPASARDLVQRAIENQLKNTTRQQYSTWKERDIKPRGTSVRQLVETPSGVLGRTLEKDGRPLTPEEVKAEDDRVNRLLDPEQMKAKAKEQKDDEERTLKMLHAIPDAFIFTYAENSKAANGDMLVHIKFTPNPDFDPPSRECLVFEGMQGDMIVDATQTQLAKIDGFLFKDVTIGWGILGRLDKGGRFVVEQKEVYKDHWDQTHMILSFTGKALLFKTVKIQEDSTAWEFQPVEKMDVRTALSFLKSKENEGGSTTANAAH
jgi:hypothetical protein